MVNTNYILHRLATLVKLNKIKAPTPIIENEIGLIERSMIELILTEQASDELIQLVSYLTGDLEDQ